MNKVQEGRKEEIKKDESEGRGREERGSVEGKGGGNRD